ncbi:MAG: hypothetical protein H0W12_06170 [Chitinophagaceae bacterium]|nr:hypothetical protein [Chitinophagaceae bacterium]
MNKILFSLFLLACTLVVFLQMRPTQRKLRTTETPASIINLELAYDTIHTAKVLTAWNTDEKVAAAKENTYIDFALIICYALFLFFSCNNLAKNFCGKMGNLGKLLSKAALIAGLLDVVENSGMLITLNGHTNAVVSLVTATCSGIKWLFIIVCFLYIVLAGLLMLYRLARHHRKQDIPKLTQPLL